MVPSRTVFSMDSKTDKLVKDTNLKVTITSRKGDYQLQVFTERAAKDADANGLRRTYSLTEIVSGGVMAENWGRQDIDGITRLLSSLLQYSDYEISHVVSDWIVKCPECSHEERGRHYETRPVNCRSTSKLGCSLKDKQKFTKMAVITEVEEPIE